MSIYTHLLESANFGCVDTRRFGALQLTEKQEVRFCASLCVLTTITRLLVYWHVKARAQQVFMCTLQPSPPPPQAQTHTCARTYTHSHTGRHAHTHTHTYPHAHSQTNTHLHHTHACTHARTRAHSYARTHSLTHSHLVWVSAPGRTLALPGSPARWPRIPTDSRAKWDGGG